MEKRREKGGEKREKNDKKSMKKVRKKLRKNLEDSDFFRIFVSCFGREARGREMP
jgi:hypothetical protein